jgi:hypothetical protein
VVNEVIECRCCRTGFIRRCSDVILDDLQGVASGIATARAGSLDESPFLVGFEVDVERVILGLSAKDVVLRGTNPD